MSAVVLVQHSVCLTYMHASAACQFQGCMQCSECPPVWSYSRLGQVSLWRLVEQVLEPSTSCLQLKYPSHCPTWQFEAPVTLLIFWLLVLSANVLSLIHSVISVCFLKWIFADIPRVPFLFNWPFLCNYLRMSSVPEADHVGITEAVFLNMTDVFSVTWPSQAESTKRNSEHGL